MATTKLSELRFFILFNFIGFTDNMKTGFMSIFNRNQYHQETRIIELNTSYLTDNQNSSLF